MNLWINNDKFFVLKNFIDVSEVSNIIDIEPNKPTFIQYWIQKIKSLFITISNNSVFTSEDIADAFWRKIANFNTESCESCFNFIKYHSPMRICIGISEYMERINQNNSFQNVLPLDILLDINKSAHQKNIRSDLSLILCLHNCSITLNSESNEQKEFNLTAGDIVLVNDDLWIKSSHPVLVMFLLFKPRIVEVDIAKLSNHSLLDL